MEIVYLLLRAALAVAFIVGLTRLNGLRSFSKMSGFDFAITVAFGSVLASIVMATEPETFWTNMGAMAALFAVQRVLSHFRTTNDLVQEGVDNDPILLMRNGEILHDNLAKTRITRTDLIGKLREANALRLQDVRAVILEDTGDISVLHGDTEVDDILLEDVRS